MPHEFDFVAAYRNRAYALRIKAELMNQASDRSAFLSIAEDYDKMAAQAEQKKAEASPREGDSSPTE